MTNKVQLGEVISITSGQIMSRVTANEKTNEEDIITCKVVVPKAILADGTIDVSELQEEKLRTEVDSKRITEVGDIVIKLSTPYDSAIVTEETAGCVIPSFCAIIKNDERINKYFLQAFLSSEYCKSQLRMQLAGATIAILSIGKVRDILIPLPSMEEQEKIGQAYLETQNRIVTMKKIVNLENKKLNLIFRNLGDE